MLSPFRKKHLKILLDSSFKAKVSLDFHVHKYFTANRCLGSKDRLWIKEGIYEIYKWKELLNYFDAKTPSELVELYTSQSSPIGKNNLQVPAYARVGFPKWLFKKIATSLGEKEAINFCLLSNSKAPITIRINEIKCDKDIFFKHFKEKLNLSPCEFSKNGFHVGKKIQFKMLNEFLEGHFEIQDEASQIIGDIVKAKPNQHILDYCAGSGGKSLSFAPSMDGKGQIHLHDIRKHSLLEAKKRLKRAGIQNFQLYHNEEKRLSSLKGKMDTVLVDAPCSCTGTFRRRPDHKLMLTKDSIDEFVTMQQAILEKAIPYVKVGGTIIYATCSILNEENENQIKYMKKFKELSLILSKTIPLKAQGSDAMYFAIFRKIPLCRKNTSIKMNA